MPPRRDTSGSDDSAPSMADQLAQLIAVTTDAARVQQTQLATLVQTTAELHAKLDTTSATTARLVNHVAEMSDAIHTDANFQDQRPPNRDQQDRPPRDQPLNRPPRPPKITLPMFDGSNPLGWMFQADNYYNYYHIPPPERVTLSAFHFTGDALSWYQNQSDNDLLGTWADFKRQLELRFGPSSYENHEAALFKLTQTTTVSAYLTAFERLSNRITGLAPHTLLNCFISGLKPELRSELSVQKPPTLHDATGLARLLEDKLSLTTKPKPYTPYRNPTATNFTPSSASSTTPPLSSQPSQITTTKPPSLPPPATPLAFHKLTPEQIQQRRREGPCFRCPAKFHSGHACSPPQFMIIVDHGTTES